MSKLKMENVGKIGRLTLWILTYISEKGNKKMPFMFCRNNID